MRGAFPKIKSREEALSAIKTTAITFLTLAVLQVALSVVVISVQSPHAPISADTLIDALVTAAIFAVLAIMLHRWNSRIVAAILLLLTVVAQGWKLAQGPPGAIGGLFLMIGLWAGVRALQATVKLQSSFVQRVAPERHAAEPLNPNADFISHPSGGLESTAASAASTSHSHKPYDREKWAALLKYDEDIARVAARIRPLGEQWLDELARAYLALNDKQYLGRIEEKIIADAMAWAARARL